MTNAREEMIKGNAALAAAALLIQADLCDDSISRAYYAAFHWARALLLVKGIEVRTHAGLARQLNLHYVKDGTMTADAAALLAHLQTFRGLGDYDAAAHLTRAEAMQMLDEATEFIAACRALAVLPDLPA